jgi:Rieske 2Fe-2S family protein
LNNPILLNDDIMNYHHTDEEGEQLIPTSGYTSEAIFRQEIENLFGRCWNFAGMADDIPEPGDYQCVQAGNYPLLVVRDLNGQIRAFHNICRHRGMAFLEGCGKAERGFQCPYHGWRYKLDGRLNVVPQKNELFPDINKSGLGLHAASVGEFRGLLFVHPESSPKESFDNFLAELEPRIGPHQPDQMVEIGRHRYEFRSNWKITLENYLDGYHKLHLHQHSIPVLDHKGLQWDGCGRHILVDEPIHPKHHGWVFRTYGIEPSMLVPGVDPETFGGSFHVIFPNLGWAALPHTWSTFYPVPTSADRTIVEVRIRVMPNAVETMKAQKAGRALPAGNEQQLVTLEDCEEHPLVSGNSMFEDMWACQQMQRGFNSPLFEVGALARKFESMLTFQQRNLLDFVDYNQGK